MPLNIFLSAFCLLSVLFSLIVCLYYWILAITSLTQKYSPPNSAPYNSFAIIIPAYNEEKNIRKTLQSCKAIDYPTDKFKIFVIADNCTDNTAVVSKSLGVCCFERFDNNQRGKGFALSYAFQKILPYNFDAVLIIDADCTICPESLKTFNNHLCTGAKCLQANYVASNPDETPMSYAVSVGNYIENELFYKGKSSLGLSVFLRGTGMVLHADVLSKIPWNAYSAVEDVDYSLHLINNNIQIKFVESVFVRSEFPAHDKQLDVQRKRWAEGNLDFSKKEGLKLILKGFFKNNLLVSDSGWTLIVLSRPLVLFQLFLSIIFVIVALLLNPADFNIALLWITIAIFLFQFIYFSTGIIFLGINKHRFYLLMKTPAVIFKLLYISLKSLFSPTSDKWIRTPR